MIMVGVQHGLELPRVAKGRTAIMDGLEDPKAQRVRTLTMKMIMDGVAGQAPRVARATLLTMITGVTIGQEVQKARKEVIVTVVGLVPKAASLLGTTMTMMIGYQGGVLPEDIISAMDITGVTTEVSTLTCVTCYSSLCLVYSKLLSPLTYKICLGHWN